MRMFKTAAELSVARKKCLGQMKKKDKSAGGAVREANLSFKGHKFNNRSVRDIKKAAK